MNPITAVEASSVVRVLEANITYSLEERIMKWEIDSTPEETLPIGTTRTLRKFAWFPTKVGDYKVWLGHYYVTQELQMIYINNFEVYGWFDEWIEVERTLFF